MSTLLTALDALSQADRDRWIATLDDAVDEDSFERSAQQLREFLVAQGADVLGAGTEGFLDDLLAACLTDSYRGTPKKVVAGGSYHVGERGLAGGLLTAKGAAWIFQRLHPVGDSVVRCNAGYEPWGLDAVTVGDACYLISWSEGEGDWQARHSLMGSWEPLDGELVERAALLAVGSECFGMFLAEEMAFGVESDLAEDMVVACWASGGSGFAVGTVDETLAQSLTAFRGESLDYLDLDELASRGRATEPEWDQVIGWMKGAAALPPELSEGHIRALFRLNQELCQDLFGF